MFIGPVHKPGFNNTNVRINPLNTRFGTPVIGQLAVLTRVVQPEPCFDTFPQFCIKQWLAKLRKTVVFSRFLAELVEKQAYTRADELSGPQVEIHGKHGNTPKSSGFEGPFCDNFKPEYVDDLRSALTPSENH